jgi:tRNA-dihydrouridine synthase
VDSVQDALQRCESYGTDGVMIGRGIFKNPWLFAPGKNQVPVDEKLQTLLLHLRLYEAAWGSGKPFVILRRFFKIYLSDFDGAAGLRQQLMETTDYSQARELVETFRKEFAVPEHTPERY